MLRALERVPGDGGDDPKSSFSSGKESEQHRTVSAILSQLRRGRNREVADLGIRRSQQVGQAGRKGPHQGRRPAKLKGKHLDPKGITGREVLQIWKTFVLRKRGGN